LILLTALVVFIQLVGFTVYFFKWRIDILIRRVVTFDSAWISVAILPLLRFILTQLFLYAFAIYLIWYVTETISDWLHFRTASRYWLGLTLWLDSLIIVVASNLYFVKHSAFTIAMQNACHFDDRQLRLTLLIAGGAGLFAVCIACCSMLLSFCRKQHWRRHGVMLAILATVWLINSGIPFTYTPVTNHRASASQPNIIIVSFDATRPDYIHYFNPARPVTPTFDAFLKKATVFTAAYTPAARTTPAWASLLTGQYPAHHGIRDNNMIELQTASTLPAILKQQGYATLYATDDRVFNAIDTHYGFDRIIGPRQTIDAAIIAALSDSPLSNLIAPTSLGKLLFPHSYGNHAASAIYDPDDFLQTLDNQLRGGSAQPLFLAVHFDLSALPFYWFNDKLAFDASTRDAYTNAIKGNDRLLKKFMQLIEARGLLQHALVILISDHGITLGLHGDRITTEKRFQGDTNQMKLKRYAYSDADQGGLKNRGIDTSYNYGSDVLSFAKQNHVLLAWRAYGIELGKPHTVAGPSLLIDIAPTILDLLQIRALDVVDGISLKPYLLSQAGSIHNSRPFYIESCFSGSDLETKNIIPIGIVKNHISAYQLDLAANTYAINPIYAERLIASKQRAIIQGDWLLAFYPADKRHHFANQRDEVPPYFVLVNLKTQQWTTSTTNPLTTNSPFAALTQQLRQFYGKEMAVY
jgi:hypothetical protein